MSPRILIALGFALAMGTIAQASEPVQQHNSNAVWFENWIGLSNASMRVASPDGRMTDVYADQGTPVFQLTGDDIADGVYRYELRAATDEMIKNTDYSDHGIGGQENPEYVPKAYYITGHFVVNRCVIITPEQIEEEEPSD